MSAAGTAGRPEGAGFVAWVAHRQWGLLLVVAALLTVQVVFRLLGGELDAAFWWLGLASLTVWLVVSPVASRHYDRLCAECVASMPVDGQARAARLDRSLHLLHWLSEPWRSTTVLGAMILAQNVLVWLLGSGTVLPVLAGYLVSLSWLVGHDWLVMRHRPLVPWCPYCRWGRDGDDAPHECVPDPVPPSIVPDRVSR